jgi:hypothetical protein
MVVPAQLYYNLTVAEVVQLSVWPVALFSSVLVIRTDCLQAVNDLVTELERANVTCQATVTFAESDFKDQLRMLRVRQDGRSCAQ